MFTFFLKSYRSGLLDFCGSSIDVNFDPNGQDSKVSFKLFENGRMKLDSLSTCHPNTLKGVIIGKKSWGLWLQQWTDGIVEGSFTEKEILNEFKIRGIEIPTPLLIDWDNVIIKKIRKRYENN